VTDNKPIRVAVVADSHFDTTSRFEECVRVHQWIAEDIKEREVQLLLHAGDVFERKSNPIERNAVAEWLTKVAEHCPVVIVRGNHDVVGDLAIFGKLETRYDVTVVEDARVVDVVPAAPFHGMDYGVQVACVSWPRKAELLAQVARQASASVGNTVPAAEFQRATELMTSPETTALMASECLQSVLRGLGAQMRQESDGGPKILLMHAMVSGSITSTGQPLVGCDMEEGLEDIGLVDADFYGLGHIHKGQDWTWNGRWIGYPGSPRRTAFGETEEKCYLIVEFTAHAHASDCVSMLDDESDHEHLTDAGTCTCGAEGRWDVTVERVPTPCAPMHLLEASYSNGEFVWLANASYPMTGGTATEINADQAEIRVRYNVPVDERAAAKEAVTLIAGHLREKGAVDVKVEEVVISTTRARAPAIARAVTLDEKLDLYWQARGFDPGDRREGLVAKLHQLETEAHNAATT
jgi:DNA repair exonuclease SbcCD nuclease subunit